MAAGNFCQHSSSEHGEGDEEKEESSYPYERRLVIVSFGDWEADRIGLFRFWVKMEEQFEDPSEPL